MVQDNNLLTVLYRQMQNDEFQFCSTSDIQLMMPVLIQVPRNSKYL